ncbi:hypothetical protein D3C71_1295320 [compost metagenome]
MSVKLLSNTINILVGLLKAAVAARTAKLDDHAANAERLLNLQHEEYLQARAELEMAQANRAIKLYKSLEEAKDALNGIQ